MPASNQKWPCFLQILAALMLALTAWQVITYTSPSALPSPIDKSIKPFAELDAKIAASENLKSVISLLTALGLGMAATIGYVIKDGLGNKEIFKALKLLTTATFFYFLIHQLLYTYASYGALAVQLDQGYLFISSIENFISLQARHLICASITLAVFLGLHIKDQP